MHINITKRTGNVRKKIEKNILRSFHDFVSNKEIIHYIQ
jgi:hypothetical protein